MALPSKSVRLKVVANKLSLLSAQINGASDELETSGATAFNWQALIALLVQIIPELIALFIGL